VSADYPKQQRALRQYQKLRREMDDRERAQRYGWTVFADGGELERKVQAARAACVRLGINPDSPSKA
jgi:hypothetical protein